jgi:dimethylargininase
MLIAVTRAVSPTFAECELTHHSRELIDVAAAVAQHACYEQALRSLGVTVVRAPAEPTLPDAVFVEDTALVLDEVAVVTRPGAPSRHAEVESIADVLSDYKPVVRMQPPGTLDGGDVLRVGRKLYVGLSSRTNRDGIAQLRSLLHKWNYEVIPVDIEGCLHLKSGVSLIAEQTLLINPDFVRSDCFASLEVVNVAPEEPDASNALVIGDSVIYPEHHPRTAERLEAAGVRVVRVPCTEIAKAEGGVTCCSLVFEADMRST